MRFLLIAVGLAAVAFALVPSVYQRIKWRDQRSRLLEWSQGLERKPRWIEQYVIDRGAKQLSVATAEQIVAPDYSSATYDGATPDPSRFFVVPPGKWVDTIDEVLATWDEHD